MNAPRDYSGYSALHQWHSTPDWLTAATWAPGVHSIAGGLLDAPVDLLVQDDLESLPDGKALAVFLTAAIGDRTGTSGPYFSGRRLAEQMRIPFVALADPTLALNETIGLGWYTGEAHGWRQNQMAAILTALAARTRRDLVLVGGSGAGFASVLLAGRTGQSAMVWNPQTDLLAYEPGAVADYLTTVLHNDDPISARESLTAAGIQTRLMDGPMPRRLLYLQNATDWHLAKHAAPFIDHFSLIPKGHGTYADGLDHVLKVGNFGSGHATPNRQIITTALEDMLKGMQPWAVFRHLRDLGHFRTEDYSTMPADLSHHGTKLTEALFLDAQVANGQLTLRVVWPQSFSTQGATAQFTLWDKDIQRESSSPTTRLAWQLHAPDHYTHATCTIKDGLAHVIATLRLAL